MFRDIRTILSETFVDANDGDADAQVACFGQGEILLFAFMKIAPNFNAILKINFKHKCHRKTGQENKSCCYVKSN